MEALILTLGSGLAGLLIGTLQHFLGFRVLGCGFGRDAFFLACGEGGGVGVVFGIPTGFVTYYALLQGKVCFGETAIIVAGSLIGGCALGIVLVVMSAFITPILTVVLAGIVRGRRTVSV